MLTKFNFLFLMPLFLMLSCNKPYSEETKGFVKYLDESLHVKVPADEHSFLLISTFKCSGCVEITLQDISNKLKDSSIRNISILTFDSTIVPLLLRNKVKVYTDKQARYEKIGIPIANICLIKTMNSRSIKVQIINLDNSQKIIREEF